MLFYQELRTLPGLPVFSLLWVRGSLFVLLFVVFLVFVLFFFLVFFWFFPSYFIFIQEESGPTPLILYIMGFVSSNLVLVHFGCTCY